MSDTVGQHQFRGRLRRSGVVAVPCAIFGVALVWFLLPAEHSSDLPIRIAAVVALLNVAGVGYSIRAATHRALDRRSRRAWRLMILCFMLLAGCGAAFGSATTEDLDGMPVGVMVAVALRVLLVVVLLAALLSFTAEPLSRRGRLKIALDVTTVLGGGAMTLWYLLIGPALAAPNRASVGVLVPGVVLTLTDLVLLLGVTVVLFRGVIATARRPVSLLMLGTVSYLVLDVYMAFAMAKEQVQFNPAVSIGITLPTFLMCLAAAEQCRLAPAAATVAPQQRPFRSHTVAPYIGLAVGFAILAVAAAQTSLFPWAGLVVGAIVMTAAVAGRQMVALRENHDLVVTDALTGLANRVRLQDAIRRAAARSRRTGDSMGILLIDMDGFKQINDTLGHDAGDRLLVAFATVLRESVKSSDTAARLGGDEFAVLLDGIEGPEQAAAVAERILARARESVITYGDTPMAMRASIGVAVANFAAEPDVADDRALLHRADVAMYAAKRTRTHSWQMYTDGLADDTEALRTGVGAPFCRRAAATTVPTTVP